MSSRPRVLVPFVKLHPATKAAVYRDAGERKFAWTDDADSYWKVLAEWWSYGKSFIVLEQDKVPEPGLLQELWDCPAVWCTVKTPMRGSEEAAPYPSLSCTKFHADLIGTCPGLMWQVGSLDLGFGEREWSRLDLGIAGLLSNHAQPHYHDGVVEHLHEPLAD